LASPDILMAASISAYSGGDNRVETNLPRFSFLGSIGLPTLFGALIYFLGFFESGGGVCSNARSASSNLTPLKFGSIAFAGRFLCFARFGSATISLSAPRNVRGFRFHQTIKLPVQTVPSNHLPIS
jgi:hypothetical protein